MQKSLLEGWMDGWKEGWVGGKAGLRIAYSNQKLLVCDSKKQFKMIFVDFTFLSQTYPYVLNKYNSSLP